MLFKGRPSSDPGPAAVFMNSVPLHGWELPQMACIPTVLIHPLVTAETGWVIVRKAVTR